MLQFSFYLANLYAPIFQSILGALFPFAPIFGALLRFSEQLKTLISSLVLKSYLKLDTEVHRLVYPCKLGWFIRSYKI